MWPGGNARCRPGRPASAAGCRSKPPMWLRRIVGPALAADVVIEAAVAVGDDIEAGDFLLVQIDGDRVDVLLAELVVHHRVEKAAHAEILRVPARPRQRAGDGGRQHDVFGGAKHVGISPGDCLSLAASLCPPRAAWKRSLQNRRRGHGQSVLCCPPKWAVFILRQNVCYS